MFFGRSVFTTVLCLLLCLSGCLGQRGAANQDPSERHWVVVTTEHFRVYSDLDGRQVETLAADLETDLRLIAQAAFAEAKPAIEPTDVVVFSRTAHFHRYFRKSTAGVSYARVPLLPESHHTVVTVKELSAPMRDTLRHELVHDLYAKWFGPAPSWFSEGFAEYFSTVQLVDGELHIGNSPPDRAVTRRFEPFTSFENGFTVLAIPHGMIPAPSALMKMDEQKFYGWESQSWDEVDTSLRAATNYFGAWAFVHFLMHSEGDYSRRFDHFLDEVKTKSVAGAWQEAFGDVKAQQLDEDFRSYTARRWLPISILPYKKPSAGQRPKLRTLETAEKHVLLAKLALAATSPEAEKEALFLEQVDAAVRSESPSPEAHYLRGMLHQVRGRSADAERDFNRAVQLAPNDPRFLRASLEHHLSEQGWSLRGPEIVEVSARIEKLESIATSPFDFFLVAQFFAATGETDRALLLADQGVGRSPVDPFVVSAYARVLESCGDLENAVAMQRLALEFAYENRRLQKQFRDELVRLEILAERPRTSVH